MKHAILDVPYVRFSFSDIDKWLRSSLPKLDIEKYLYRKALHLQAHRGSCARRSGNGFTDLNEPVFWDKNNKRLGRNGNPVFGPASNLAVVHEIILGGVHC